MFNQQILQRNWNEIKGKLRNKWAALTDDDLQGCRGDMEQLIGAIQRKTGEARESIENFFDDLSSGGASAISRAAEAVRGYAQQATEAIYETSQQGALSVREGYNEVEYRVRQRPAESLAVCFGIGVVTGVVVSLLLRRH